VAVMRLLTKVISIFAVSHSLLALIVLTYIPEPIEPLIFHVLIVEFVVGCLLLTSLKKGWIK